MLFTAIARPINRLAFSLALFNLKTVLLVITSFLKSIKYERPSCKFKVIGLVSFNASILLLKEDFKGVY